ncbi:GNAT family N-acetyltransferase [Catelliglobosispora koreensis]|uniref:GNAT family N-acetyltransferase n=1 Tax=Catelliglobosispora koreensis TaxID=129052 RepID=UPI0003664FBC|nr:GNAT family N-acetyltransferase [Catelliglobosispora koreensis]
MGVTIRAGGVGDAAAVAEIWRSGWRDGHLGHVPDALVEARTPQWFDDRAAELVGNTTVAMVDGQVAGFIMVHGDEVEQVYVLSAHRGSGIASLLLEEAERQVRSNGHGRAWLAVVAGNSRARRFYERQGWSDGGEFEHQAPSPDGPITVPCLRYVKNVGH